MNRSNEQEDDNIRRQRISDDFSKLKWHDSQVVSFQILKSSLSESYEVELKLYLVTGFENGNYIREKTKLLFKGCRFAAIDFDLILMAAQSGAISSASCHKNENELKQEEAIKFDELYSYKLADLLNEYLYFHFKMIAPSGEIIIIANQFEVSSI